MYEAHVPQESGTACGGQAHQRGACPVLPLRENDEKWVEPEGA